MLWFWTKPSPTTTNSFELKVLSRTEIEIAQYIELRSKARNFVMETKCDVLTSVYPSKTHGMNEISDTYVWMRIVETCHCNVFRELLSRTAENWVGHDVFIKLLSGWLTVEPKFTSLVAAFVKMRASITSRLRFDIYCHHFREEYDCKWA